MKKISGIVGMVVLLSACSCFQSTPSGTGVSIANQKPSKQCFFLGQVSANNRNSFTGGWMSQKELEMRALDNLKVEAARIGANYVHYVGSDKRIMGTDNRGNQMSVIVYGDGYTCPSLRRK